MPTALPRGFHSTDFPSEWGHLSAAVWGNFVTVNCVSIQLISPASGDHLFWVDLGVKRYYLVSIQLISPASGDSDGESGSAPASWWFPFN